MAHQWKAGDLAVCVNPGSKILSYRSIYRVEAVTPVRKWIEGFVGVGLILVGVRHPKNTCGDFCCKNLRPILPAEPAFTEAMRSLRPKVEA